MELVEVRRDGRADNRKGRVRLWYATMRVIGR